MNREFSFMSMMRSGAGQNSCVKRVFDYVQGRIAFNADIFWTKSSIGQEAIDLWLETYQMTRDFESRGIVEVTINDKE